MWHNNTCNILIFFNFIFDNLTWKEKKNQIIYGKYIFFYFIKNYAKTKFGFLVKVFNLSTKKVLYSRINQIKGKNVPIPT